MDGNNKGYWLVDNVEGRNDCIVKGVTDGASLRDEVDGSVVVIVVNG